MTEQGLYLVDNNGHSRRLQVAGFQFDLSHLTVDLKVVGADPRVLEELLQATYHINELPPEEDGKNETE